MFNELRKLEWRLFAIVALLPILMFDYFAREAAADVPPPYFDCDGNPVTPEEYAAMLDWFDVLGGPDGIYAQAFVAPFGGCEEGGISCVLDAEPQLLSHVSWYKTDTGWESVVVDYPIVGEMISGVRYPYAADPEPFSIRVLDYITGEPSQEFHDPNIGAYTGRVAVLYCWLDGPTGTVPIRAVLYIGEHPAFAPTIFMQISNKLSPEMIESLEFAGQMMGEADVAEPVDFDPADVSVTHIPAQVDKQPVADLGLAPDCDRECFLKCIEQPKEDWRKKMNDARKAHWRCVRDMGFRCIAGLEGCFIISFFTGPLGGLTCTIGLTIACLVTGTNCDNILSDGYQDANDDYWEAEAKCKRQCCPSHG